MSDAQPVAGADLVHTVGSGVSLHWLESMRRDGLLIRVGPAHYLRADAAQWPAARLLALRSALPAGCVAGLASAVWGLGGPGSQVDPTHTRVHVCALARPHLKARTAPGLTLYRTPLEAEDVREICGTRLTTDARTLADLALLGTAADDEALAWLLRHRPVTVAAAVTVLRRRGRAPGVRRAGEVLRLLKAGASDPLAQTPLPAPAGLT